MFWSTNRWPPTPHGTEQFHDSVCLCVFDSKGNPPSNHRLVRFNMSVFHCVHGRDRPPNSDSQTNDLDKCRSCHFPQPPIDSTAWSRCAFPSSNCLDPWSPPSQQPMIVGNHQQPLNDQSTTNSPGLITHQSWRRFVHQHN